jgi:hypothetical protein
MARPETGSNLVVYEAPPVSVGDEATCLSAKVLPKLLRHIEEVLDGRKRYDQFRVWKTYRGVPLFMAEISGELMIYAVEHVAGEPLSECKISVMFAGVRRVGHIEGNQHWNGTNDEVLWTAIVQPRCSQHFM